MSARRLHFTLRATLFVLVFSPGASWADESEPAAELTPAESEFVALIGEFHAKLDDYWTKVRQYSEHDARIEFERKHDPGIEYLPRLLAFEDAHSGDDAGLLALSEVSSYAAGNRNPDTPTFFARRAAIERMLPYEDRELAILFVAHLSSGAYDPQVLDYLRRLGESTDAYPTLRAFAQREYADKVLSLRATRRESSQQLQDFADGMPSNYPDQEQDYRDLLNRIPSATELDTRANEAVAILGELAASGDLYRVPVFRDIDSAKGVLRIDPKAENSKPPLSARAAALLFEESHLRPGQPSPNLQLELIDGDRWSLADQHGRVVVIQFSSTGCGPCEGMYPDLRRMSDELGDRASLLTILRSQTRDSALDASESGKITWDIAWDGDGLPGIVGARWAVDSFPTIYVIDRDGKIAAVNLRGKQLRWKVEQLLAVKNN